jgi:hypothetical protein
MTKVIFNTYGDGYWSNVAKPVEIVDMRLGYISDELDFGELRVYFNTDTWDVNTDGLIYTDSRFKQDLMQFVKQQGLVVDLCYSEQGMQGDDYVSLDVGKEFLDSWAAKFGTNLARMLQQQEEEFAARWG